MDTNFWFFQLAKFALLGTVAFLTGHLALSGVLKVNYTRKINHFAISFLPDWVFQSLSYKASNLTLAAGALVSLGYFVLFLKPVRSHSPVLQTMFAAIDRPEDRPHTVFWFISQYAAAIAVMVPMYLYFKSLRLASVALIPLLINNIGDGLAEPVGVRFGRFRYATRALFSNKRYVRTIEGSACILITGVIVILCHAGCFTTVQLIAALMTIPLVMTLVEAIAPHTWDAPFLLLSGGTVLAMIMSFL